MKKSIAIFMLLSCLDLFGQKSGNIDFIEAVKFQIDIPESNKELMKNMPQSHSIKKVLFFKGQETIYKERAGNEDLEVTNENEGNQINFVMKTPESTLYSDLKNKTMVHSQEFFGKHFLVTGDLKKYTWKITGEQKTLLDMVCQKAILQDTAQNVIAWFTTQLPIGGGPNGFTGLPGMILSLDIDDGSRVITAEKIVYRDLLPEELVKPDKGKQMGVEEFEKMKKEKMKEMGAVNGKGGAMKIMIREERH